MDEEHSALTERELAVLQLTVQGCTAKEVSVKLGIAPRTVEKHIDHVRLKLRAKNRAHLAARAIRLGLVHPSSGE